MFETDLNSLTEFLEYWNNKHLVNEKGTKPFNDYAMGAWQAGAGFTLKWFVSKTCFDKLVQELDYEFEPNEKRIFIEYGEDRIEIEIDNRNILPQIYEETQVIRDVVDSALKH